VITNDQGAHLVDTARVAAAGYPVEEITGGCFCCRLDGLVDAVRRVINRSEADVIIAEPVGSCTDLVATVGYPLQHLYPRDFELAMLSVLVDPIRCAHIVGLRGGKSFSEKVLYVYRKQLEEAQLLVINKIDLVPQEDRLSLEAALEKQFPQARVFGVSCQTGEGLEAWFECLLASRLAKRPALEVDYDRYAAGEALLGWLNATVEISGPGPFDGNAWLMDVSRRMWEALAVAGIETGHLKMTLKPDEGPDVAAVSAVPTEAGPQLTHRLQAPLTRGQLLINVRAEADPEVLTSRVREALSGWNSEQVGAMEIQAFRPGRPIPSHRMDVAKSSPPMN
jgi:Ni2+-binding GTPase involved in maturation of urease and hydrogenase